MIRSMLLAVLLTFGIGGSIAQPATSPTYPPIVYDDEYAFFEFRVIKVDGSEYWAEDSEGNTLYFVSKNLLGFRQPPNIGDWVQAVFSAENTEDGLVAVEPL